MSYDKERSRDEPEEELVKPVAPSSQPGTPLEKAPDEPFVKPAEPSKNPGTAMPFGEPREK